MSLRLPSLSLRKEKKKKVEDKKNEEREKNVDANAKETQLHADFRLARQGKKRPCELLKFGEIIHN